MVAKINIEITPEAFNSSRFSMIRTRCDASLKEYAGTMRNIVSYIDTFEGLKSEKKNFKLFIFSAEDVELVCFFVNGGFGIFTRTEYTIRNGKFLQTKNGIFQRCVNFGIKAVKSLTIGVSRYVKNVVKEKVLGIKEKAVSETKKILEREIVHRITGEIQSQYREFFKINTLKILLILLRKFIKRFMILCKMLLIAIYCVLLIFGMFWEVL